MIGKIPKTGKGFRGSFNYLIRGKRDAENPERLAWMETRNLFVDDMEKVPRMMRATAAQSRKCQKPVYHFLVSWREDEAPADATMRLVADQALADLGLTEHQAVLAAHRDTRHRHLHILVNRVHPETGRAWHTGKDWERLERSIARQALELGFLKVDGRHNTPEKMADASKRVRDSEYQMARKTSDVPRDRWSKDQIAVHRLQLGPVFDQARSWDHLTRLLATKGLSLSRKGQGLVIGDGDGFMKLSDLGKDIRLKSLEAIYREPFAQYERRCELQRPQDLEPARSSNGLPVPPLSNEALRSAMRAHRAHGPKPSQAAPQGTTNEEDGGVSSGPAYRPSEPRSAEDNREGLYARVRDARTHLDYMRDLHAEGRAAKQDVVRALDAHAAARDDLARSLETQPGRETLRDDWKQQHARQRAALEAVTPVQPRKPGSTDAESTQAGASSPPARELTPARPAVPAASAARREAQKGLSCAFEHADLARQLHVLGLISKQDLVNARQALTAAQQQLARHQTFQEFVADGVRQALSPRRADEASPVDKAVAPKPDKQTDRKPKKDFERER